MVRVVPCRLLGLMICGLVLPDNLQAQAWVPPREEVSVTTSYQYVTVTRHYDWRGGEWNRGHIRADSLTLGIEYGITDRLALSMNVPYVWSVYHGPYPHQLPIDNGAEHATFQDYRMSLRYNIVRGRFMVTPFVGLVAPSHNYTYLAHSAAGRDLHEQTMGVNIGVPLDPDAGRVPCGCVVPQLYVQGRYAYSFVERVLGIPHNKSNVDVDAGYFVTPATVVRVLASGQKTHGGIGLDYLNLPPKGTPLFNYHDQIIADDYLNVGTGASYSVSESVDVFVIALRTIWGHNGHKMDLSFTTGIGYSFNGRQAIDRLQRRLIARS
jgi:hypothetical protein